MIMLKKYTKHVLVFMMTTFICIAALLLVCQIPQSAIEENSRASAEYFLEQEAFPLLKTGRENTRIDNYADCVLFDVIWYTDSENSFRSMITAPYHRNEGADARDDYYGAIAEGKEANSEYSRYWHGSQVLIRPLLTFTSITGIRGILFGLLIGLNAALLFLLFRKKYFRVMIVYLISMLFVHVWMTAFSLEYIMTFLVMTAICIAVAASKKTLSDESEQWILHVFIVAGSVTC